MHAPNKTPNSQSRISPEAGTSAALIQQEQANRTARYFFFQAEDGIRDYKVTGVQTCALPISLLPRAAAVCRELVRRASRHGVASRPRRERSEEHTSELQSPCNLVCRLLL